MPVDWIEPWWVWQPESAGIGDWTYRVFNLLEGVAWCGFAILVLNRWRRHRRSRGEWAYAAAFTAFGSSDFREAYAQSLPLLAIKGVILIWLLVSRHRACMSGILEPSCFSGHVLA